MDNITTEHIGALIKMLNTGIEKHMNDVSSEVDLTGTQTRVLHYLCVHSEEDITQCRLEKIFRLNHATLSGILSRLEGKGFIETARSSSDRRVRTITPTSRAFDCDSAMHRHIIDCESRLAANLTDEQLAAVRETLKIMIKNISKGEDNLD